MLTKDKVKNFLIVIMLFMSCTKDETILEYNTHIEQKHMTIKQSNTQLQGFNQTHLINHITDEKAVIIPEALQRLKDEIPEERRQVIRFPGGTEANFYNCDMPGYSPQEKKNSKYVRNNKNILDLFICSVKENTEVFSFCDEFVKYFTKK